MVDTCVQVFANEIPQIDAQSAGSHIRLNDGCVAVECWPGMAKSAGGILLPDEVKDAYRNQPDIGTVIRAAGNVPLSPGDVVLFNHAHGKRISGYSVGDYSTDNQVRIFGRTVFEDDGLTGSVPWDRSIFARLVGFDEGVGKATIVPLGRWALVRRDKLNDSVEVEGTDIKLVLPVEATWRNTQGTVVAVGEDCDFLMPGDEVVYMATAVKTMETIRNIVGPDYHDRNLCLIEESAILLRVERDS